MEELREQRGKKEEAVEETKWSVFGGKCAGGEIHHRRYTAGSSSTLQPLFYGVDTATAAAFSSVRALTPPGGVAHEQAYVWASRSVHLHICVCVCLCVCVCAGSHLFVSYVPLSERCSVCRDLTD